MDASKQVIVRRTFATLLVMPEVAGALFYERLFADHPEFRPLFKNDMRIQADKLITMLALIVSDLTEPEPDKILPAIRELSIRHTAYGVKLDDYDAMLGALLWTLEQVLGSEFTPAVQEAWTACYGELADVMKAAVAI